MSAIACAASLALSDIPIPSNVHRYYTPGAYARRWRGQLQLDFSRHDHHTVRSVASHQSDSGDASPTMRCTYAFVQLIM